MFGWKGCVNVLLLALLIGLAVWLESIHSRGPAIDANTPFHTKLRIEMIKLITAFSGLLPGSDPASFTRVLFNTFVPTMEPDSVNSYKVHLQTLDDKELTLGLFVPEITDPKSKSNLLLLNFTADVKL